MPTDYIIKGEAGKALDASSRFLGADLLATNATLRFESLESDVLQWTCRTESLTASETILPDVGQKVELWSADNSTRYFRGHVTQARLQNYGVQVVVEGPWQWLVKTDVSSSQTLETTQDRPTIIFEQDQLDANITALLNRAIALQLPIGIGEITSAYAVPKLQLSTITFADALAELMRWAPDSVGWWDYSGSGTPTFNFSRRATMPVREYTIGTAPLSDFDLTGRPDLVPSRVEIKYIERQIDQRPALAEQSSGPAFPGRVQTIGVSGTEFDTFLPADNYESYIGKTQIIGTSAITATIPEVIQSRETFNGFPSDSQVTVSTGGSYQETTTNPAYSFGWQKKPLPPAYSITNANPNDVDDGISRPYLVTTELRPEWAASLYENARKVIISGTLYSFQVYFNASNQFVYNEPEWSKAFNWTRINTAYVGTPPPGGERNSNPTYVLNTLPFSFEAYITSSNIPNPITIYKPQDYDYTAPPSGLAESLLTCQSFIPYEGSMRLQSNEIGSLKNLLSYKFNVAGAHAGLESAGALPRAVTYDLSTQSIDIEVGSPTRFDFSTLGAKLRPTPQTNITINR